MDVFYVGILFVSFVLFVLFIFGVIFVAAVCSLDIKTTSESKPPFNPFLTEDEQMSFTDRFRKYGFIEIPNFMYGVGKIPRRESQMQFSHYSGCYVIISKNIEKECFKFEIKYKKTVIKTFDDLDNLNHFLWNFYVSYKDNRELVIKNLEVSKREALAAGDFE